MIPERVQPVHFLDRIPHGWLDASLPKFNAALGTRLTSEANILAQENRWREITDISAEDTHFTIIVPIRNEGILLQSMLGTLALSDIPTRAEVTYIFVTNNCTDSGESDRIVGNFMQKLGTVSIKNVGDILSEDGYSDPKLNPEYRRVKVDNTEYIHLNTETAGKANVLNLANAIAQIRGPIAMCIDADTFVEPDAIPRLYKHAYDAFVMSPESQTAIVHGKYRSENIKEGDWPDKLRSYYDSGLTPKDLLPIIRNKPFPVRGAFWAWNPKTMLELGGIPNVAVEDGAFWMIAKNRGKRIKEVEDANLWGFLDCSFEARRRMLIRFVRGWLQTIQLHPGMERDIRELYLNLKNPNTGLEWDDLVKWQESNPKVLNKTLPIIFGLWKEVYLAGLEDFRNLQGDSSWNPAGRRPT